MTKITDLVALTGASVDSANDLFTVVDVSETGAARNKKQTFDEARIGLGLGTAASPQFTAINIGHASDTTITRTGAGDIAVEGNALYRAGGTDVPLADGGTGASLSDPNADRVLFWDDSAGQVTWLQLGTGLSITGTTIDAAAGSGYTDEQAQDAVGTIFTDTGLAVVTYSDATPSIDVNVPAAAGSDFRTGTDATKALTSDAAWDAAAYVTLNDSGGNIAVDLSTGLNFTMTMDGDYTLSAPSNGKPGQTGVIVLTQDGTGTQTLAYNSAWKFAGGTDPTLSTAASTVDLLFYQVLPNGTDVYANLVKAIS